MAYAAVGDARGAELALTQAWREIHRGVDDPDDPVELLFVTPAEIRSLEARVRDYLGQHDRAATIYAESVYSEDSTPRDEASYRAYYSASLARLGDHSAALTEGLSALALLEGPVKSHRLVTELQPARAVADRARGDDAEQFRLRYDALAAV
jgi:hypothetical protein